MDVKIADQSRTSLLLCGLLSTVAFAFLYRDAVTGMVLDWYDDPNYSHGFLIPLVSAYLVWQKREVLAAMPVRGATAGLAVILFGLGMLLVGLAAGESFTMRVSMLVVMGGAILFVCGWPLLREVLFPFGFLVFMIPLPYLLYDSVAFPLKLEISRLSVLALQAIGVPVIREGNIIHLTNTSLEVADACSGIRSIISLLALATAMAYFSQRGLLRKGVLVLSAIPIAMFANGIRVVGTGLLASRYGPEVAHGFFHEFAGLAIFGVAMVLLVGVAVFLAKAGGRSE